MLTALVLSSLSAPAEASVGYWYSDWIHIDDPCTQVLIDGEPPFGCDVGGDTGTGTGTGSGGGGGGGGGTGSGGGGTGGSGGTGAGAGVVVPPGSNPVVSPEVAVHCFDVANNDDMTHRLVLYVDQPIANSPAPYGNWTLGHTYIGIEQDQGSSTVTSTFGLYPDRKVSSGMWHPGDANGVLRDDGGESFDVAVVIDLTANEFDALIDAVLNLNSTPQVPYFILEGYNDVDWAIDMAAAAGLTTLPDPKLPYVYQSFRASSSADFGQDLRSWTPPANVVVDDQGGTAPESSACSVIDIIDPEPIRE